MGFARNVIVMGAVARRSLFLWWPLATNASPGRGGVKNTRDAASRFVAAACYGLFGYGYIIPATSFPRWRADISTIQRCSAGWRCSAAAALPHLPRHGSVSAGAAALWTGAHGSWWPRIGPCVSLNVVTLLAAAICWRHLHGHYLAGIKEVLRSEPAGVAGCRHDDRCFAVGQSRPLVGKLFAGSACIHVTSIIAALGLPWQFRAFDR